MNPSNSFSDQSNADSNLPDKPLKNVLFEKTAELAASQSEQKRSAVDDLIKARCSYFIAARNAKNLTAGDDLEKSVLSLLECMGSDGATLPELIAVHRKRENLERTILRLTNEGKITPKFTVNRMVLVLA
jgi:hypothetical protein